MFIAIEFVRRADASSQRQRRGRGLAIKAVVVCAWFGIRDRGG
jgi:hypothetical protein